MRAAGLANVHTEPVRVRRWVRGPELFELVAPSTQPIHGTAIGGSVGTPPAGITGELIEVEKVEDAAKLGEAARGKIVFYNRKMTRMVTGEGYGPAVAARHRGASAAARLGAIAVLVRSAGTAPGRLPHTGALDYDKDVPR